MKFKQKFTNFFGGLGYIFCAMQWLWVILLYFSYISKIISFMTPSTSVQTPEPLPVVTQAPSPLLLVIGLIIAAIMVALTIFVIIKLPSTITKTSRKLVHKSADAITPTILHIQHKKDTKRNKIKLNFGLVLIIKMSLVIIPIILSFMSQFIERQSFDFYIAMCVSLFLASLSFIFFGIQYSLMKLLSIDKKDVF